MTPKNLLTEIQAGEFLGMTTKCLRNWRGMGVGPKFCKFGRSGRYDPRDLEDFVNKNRHQGTGEYAKAV